ncbi:MAG TPA: hypothetical protein VFE88_03075 [Candidatus Nanoarchaeia archaeon]|nr:hypothetical protein [Candidatus Nanoarchaeia archaeon]
MIPDVPPPRQNYDSSMDPKFFFHSARLGAPTSPMHAKQLEEFGKRLNSGIKNIELGTIDPDKFEFIPKEHFETIRQLAILTDTKPSVHGPIVDLAGFDERSGRWSEADRRGTAERVWSIIERSHELDRSGNLPVVFHAGAVLSQERGKGLKEEARVFDPKTGEVKIQIKDYDPQFLSMRAVNTVSGETTLLNYEKKYSIADGKEHIWTPHTKLDSLNTNQWDEEKLKIFGYQKEIEELNQKVNLKQKQNEAIKATGLDHDKEYAETLARNERDVTLLREHIDNVHTYLSSSVSEAYNKFKKSTTTTKDQGLLEEAKNFEKKRKEIYEKFKVKELSEQYRTSAQHLQAVNEALKTQLEEEQRRHLEQQRQALEERTSLLALERTKAFVTEVAAMPTPELWRPVNEFAIEKTTETIAETMLKSYDKFKEQSPFISIENFWPNTPMSSAEDLRKAVLEARKLLAEKLIKQRGVPEKKAEHLAEKMIAATWDVGHIYNLRKAGYEGEELKKEILRQTKHVADVTRHVHITDNFGFHDSHLPPGMAQVPVGEMMAELDKTWEELRAQGKLHVEPRLIIEAGGLVGEIGQDPTIPGLAYFHSPLYAGAAPLPGGYWRDPAPFGHYGSLFIEFPQQHFNLYGSSFTTLPKELGGQVTGEKSRFSDTPTT